MLKVKLGNRTLGVVFQREYEMREVEKSTGDGTLSKVEKVPDPKATWCELHRIGQDGKTEAVVARSRALLAHPAKDGRPRDRFSDELGRKLTLRRALKQYGLQKGERTLIWSAYHSRPRPVSKPKVKPVIADPLILEGSPAGAGTSNQQADGYREPSDLQHPDQLTLHAGEV